RRQPCHVQRLAAQRHEHAAAGGQPERRPVLLEQRQHALLVEADLVVAPALAPEIRVHGSALGSGPAPPTCFSIPGMTAGGAAPAPDRVRGRLYSTDSPSTFCHPRGSSPPRLARAPTYWSRSLNDSDI